MLAVLLTAMDAPASFEFAREYVTQLLTLATAVIAVSITFAKEFAISGGAGSHLRKVGLLYAAWIAFMLSLVLGMLTLGALVGTLATVANPTPRDVYGGSVVVYTGGQFLSFLVGITLLAAQAVRRLRQS